MGRHVRQILERVWRDFKCLLPSFLTIHYMYFVSYIIESSFWSVFHPFTCWEFGYKLNHLICTQVSYSHCLLYPFYYFSFIGRTGSLFRPKFTVIRCTTNFKANLCNLLNNLPYLLILKSIIYHLFVHEYHFNDCCIISIENWV